MKDPSYDAEFFEQLDEPAARSAAIVWDILSRHIQPSSVVDVGCGTGQWLLEARRRFNAETLGIDGRWNVALESNVGDHCYVDFESDFSIDRLFDMAICLEVAEHLTGDASVRLIQELCRASDVVLFSAAVEEQPGEHHINCKWQSEWMLEFEKRGFICLDVLRPLVWAEPQVAWWYKQNMFLAVAPSSDRLDQKSIGKLQAAYPTDIVHPENYVVMLRGYAEENRKVWSELEELREQLYRPTGLDLLNALRRYPVHIARRLKRQFVPRVAEWLKK